MINHLQLDERITTAGQPEREEFREVAAAGHQVVINLAMADSPDSILDEGDVVRSLGMGYIHIPVEWENPTLENLIEFFQVMQAHQAHKVFVHCVLNMRVSVFMFLYRVVRLGQSQASAWQDVERIWQPDETWTAFIEKALGRPDLRTRQEDREVS